MALQTISSYCPHPNIFTVSVLNWCSKIWRTGTLQYAVKKHKEIATVLDLHFRLGETRWSAPTDRRVKNAKFSTRSSVSLLTWSGGQGLWQLEEELRNRVVIGSTIDRRRRPWLAVLLIRTINGHVGNHSPSLSAAAVSYDRLIIPVYTIDELLEPWIKAFWAPSMTNAKAGISHAQ